MSLSTDTADSTRARARHANLCQALVDGGVNDVYLDHAGACRWAIGGNEVWPQDYYSRVVYGRGQHAHIGWADTVDEATLIVVAATGPLSTADLKAACLTTATRLGFDPADAGRVWGDGWGMASGFVAELKASARPGLSEDELVVARWLMKAGAEVWFDAKGAARWPVRVGGAKVLETVKNLGEALTWWDMRDRPASLSAVTANWRKVTL